jgi:hypothetical protein
MPLAVQSTAMNLTYNWQFPLPRTHIGMLQGKA